MLWHVEWAEHPPSGESRTVERRYRTSGRAARQIAAVLAAPDDVAALAGVWVTSGWSGDRLAWTRLDPDVLLDELATASELDPDEDDGVAERYRLVAQAWRDARAS